MRISFFLDGEEITANTDPKLLLSEFLQTRSGEDIESSRIHDDYSNCTLLVDGVLLPADFIPLFTVIGKQITTIEGFSRTDEFADIRRGFDRARFYPCIHCRTGKYFLTHILIEENPNPRKSKMSELISSSRCRCTNYSRYADGIIFAAQYRRKRHNG